MKEKDEFYQKPKRKFRKSNLAGTLFVGLASLFYFFAAYIALDVIVDRKLEDLHLKSPTCLLGSCQNETSDIGIDIPLTLPGEKDPKIKDNKNPVIPKTTPTPLINDNFQKLRGDF